MRNRENGIKCNINANAPNESSLNIKYVSWRFKCLLENRLRLYEVFWRSSNVNLKKQLWFHKPFFNCKKYINFLRFLNIKKIICETGNNSEEIVYFYLFLYYIFLDKKKKKNWFKKIIITAEWIIYDYHVP